MDLVTSIPVRVHRAEAALPLLEHVRERITRRAYEKFVERDCAPGRDFDDWIDAERELIVRPGVAVRVGAQDAIVETILPEMDLPDLSVHIGPHQIIILSDVGRNGFQICQVIDLPVEISMDGVDAEQTQNTLRVTAAVA